MLKELLSNSIKVLQPHYQSDSFQPYLTAILTIVSVTFFVYGFQLATINMYTYANNPGLFEDKIQTQLCVDFRRTSFYYICKGVQVNGANDYTVSSLVSPAQDIHKVTN